jgi:hypothetical protein
MGQSIGQAAGLWRDPPPPLVSCGGGPLLRPEPGPPPVLLAPRDELPRPQALPMPATALILYIFASSAEAVHEGRPAGALSPPTVSSPSK